MVIKYVFRHILGHVLRWILKLLSRTWSQSCIKSSSELNLKKTIMYSCENFAENLSMFILDNSYRNFSYEWLLNIDLLIAVPNKTIQWVCKTGFLFDLSLKKKTTWISFTTLLHMHLVSAFTNERMFLCAGHISPLVACIRVLHQDTILVATNIVWLPGIPVGIGYGSGRASVCPYKMIFRIFVISGNVKSVLASRH